MPTKPHHLVYWDTSVFLSYLNQIPGRWQIIQSLWDDIRQRQDALIITSAFTMIEVSHVNSERLRGKLDSKIEDQLRSFWYEPSLQVVELSQEIALMATDLIRRAIPHDWILKPKDAIHLATAQWVYGDRNLLKALHTYDKGLVKYHSMIGIPIGEPADVQLRFSLGGDE